MSLFSARARQASTRETALQHYRNARGNLLLAVIFTVVNCILALTGSGTYFLFSCTIPYAMINEGLFYCGMLFTPEEYMEYWGVSELDFLPREFLYILAGIAIAVVLVYVAFFFLSKKQAGWMIAATAFFGIDFLFLLVWYGIDLSMALDYLFHVWVMFILIRGLVGFYKAKKIPEGDPQAATVVLASADPLPEAQQVLTEEQAPVAEAEVAVQPRASADAEVEAEAEAEADAGAEDAPAAELVPVAEPVPMAELMPMAEAEQNDQAEQK